APERALDRLLLHDHCFRTRVIRGDRLQKPIRVWLQPRQGGRGQRGAPWVGGRGHLRREPPRPAPLEQVEAGVRRDSVEPRTKRGAAFEAAPAFPRAQVRLLHPVLCVLERADHAVAVNLQLPPIALDQQAERGLVACACGGGDRVRFGFGPPPPPPGAAPRPARAARPAAPASRSARPPAPEKLLMRPAVARLQSPPRGGTG